MRVSHDTWEPFPGFAAGLIPSALRAADDAEPNPDWFISPRVSAHDRDDWFREVTPTEPQTTGSCAFRTAAQAYMAMVRRELGQEAIPKGYIIDGDEFHRRFCDEHYGDGDYQKGAQLDDGVHQMAKDGVFGSVRYGVAKIPFRYDLMSQLIRVTPLLLGFALTPLFTDADPLTGQVPFGGLPSLAMGHATVCVDMQQWGDSQYLIGANSWGLDWGRYGYYTVTLNQAKQMALADVMGLYLPDGVGTNFEKFLRAS